MREGLKTMVEEVEFLTGPELGHHGQLEVILADADDDAGADAHWTSTCPTGST